VSRYSLLHLECHLMSISNRNLFGLFSTECGKRDLENQVIDWDVRMKKQHSKCNRLYIWPHVPWLYNSVLHTPYILCRCVCVPQRISMCAMTRSHVCYDAHPCVSSHDTIIHTPYTLGIPSCVYVYMPSRIYVCVQWWVCTRAHIKMRHCAMRTHMRGYIGCRVCG